MAKTNFTKVENLLETELAKREALALGELADIAQNVEQPAMRKIAEKAAIASHKALTDRASLLHALKKAMKDFKTPEFYTYLGVESENLKELLHTPIEQLKQEDWKLLQQLRKKVVEYRKEYAQAHPEVADDKIIEKERTKHINKRFNIKERWLPLQ